MGLLDDHWSSTLPFCSLSQQTQQRGVLKSHIKLSHHVTLEIRALTSHFKLLYFSHTHTHTHRVPFPHRTVLFTHVGAHSVASFCRVLVGGKSVKSHRTGLSVKFLCYKGLESSLADNTPIKKKKKQEEITGISVYSNFFSGSQNLNHWNMWHFKGTWDILLQASHSSTPVHTLPEAAEPPEE